jgi:hypothetical protein
MNIRTLRKDEYLELDHGTPLQKWHLKNLAQQSEAWQKIPKSKPADPPRRAAAKKSLR